MIPQVTTQQKPQLSQPVQLHRCAVCGTLSANLAGNIEWAGGVGYVTVWSCKDSAACWARHDAQHGLVK